MFKKLKQFFCNHQNIKVISKFKGLEHDGYDLICRNCDKTLN